MGLFRTEAGWVIDLFLVLLVALLPALLVGVALARRRLLRAHGVLMTVCFVLFMVGVVAFEIQVRFGAPGPALPRTPLAIHLCFAIPCALLWIRQVWTARRARREVAAHGRRGRLLLVLFAATLATGVWLYTATFV